MLQIIMPWDDSIRVKRDKSGDLLYLEVDHHIGSYFQSFVHGDCRQSARLANMLGSIRDWMAENCQDVPCPIRIRATSLSMNGHLDTDFAAIRKALTVNDITLRDLKLEGPVFDDDDRRAALVQLTADHPDVEIKLDFSAYTLGSERWFDENANVPTAIAMIAEVQKTLPLHTFRRIERIQDTPMNIFAHLIEYRDLYREIDELEFVIS